MHHYLVITTRTPNFQPSVIEAHNAFLDKLRAQNMLVLSGPFTDKSGGAYLMKATSLEAAEAVAFSDPVHTTHSSVVIVHEWSAR